MILGTVLALFSAVVYNVGFLLEKRALHTLPPISVRHPARLIWVLATSPAWLVGFVLIGTGMASQIVALSLVPLSVAQPIQLSGLALLVLCSTIFLGERAHPREWAGLGVLVVALALVYLSLEPDRDKVGTEANVGVMLAVSALSAAVGLGAFLYAARGVQRNGRPVSGVLYGAAAGLLYGVGGLQTKGIGGLFADRSEHGFVAEALMSPYPYLLVLMSGMGLLLFQTGLQRGRASIVVPVSQVVGNVYLVMTGTIAFGEPLPEDPVRLVLRLTGFLVAIGVVVFMPQQDPPDAPGTENRLGDRAVPISPSGFVMDPASPGNETNP